ncbi:hypothetical protein AALP_AA8G165600 [Arabis alpina]|uniref:Uncharacterized protein n=1 Tax=Arabis alpina TaxID=50452 RepID=A0A087G7G8_ARAAL|nr:hypothetical protein AALP_AA8G165600 [Arabis alpina]
MKFGRPDTDFTQWKWKPDGCEDGVPVFDPLRFLEIMRGKTMAFVGDSVSRNHMQSLICLLSQVEYPVDASVTTNDYFKRWTYETFNFTIAPFWTQHLVKSTEPDPTQPKHTNLFDIYLDEVDESWTTEIGDFDYVIISSGHWHFRPSVYYENRTIIDSFNGVMYLRTFAPSHFEGGLWNEGGDCLRKQPYQRNQSQDEITMKLHKIQLEEFWRAEEEAKKKAPALYYLLTNPILPASFSFSETDRPSPSDHTQISLNSTSNQIPSPVNGSIPIPAPPDRTPSGHRKFSSDQIPSPKISLVPSSSDQSPSPENSASPAPLSLSDDHSPPAPKSTSRTQIKDDEQRCDLFTGEWVPNEDAPYYTNTTCSEIHPHQNCMKNGRPDTGFMRYRWKPDGCDLPIFDPREFLEMARGKAMGFVGDSVSRNQVQSLVCLLSRVEYPQDISPSPATDIKVWNYTSYNFTLHAMWSPFLVKTTNPDPTGPKANLFSLYLDEYTEWMSQIDQLDYLVISSGHWKALRISLKAILESFKGLAILRSFSPQHFEGGAWNEGGGCVRTRPYRRNETIPEAEGPDLKLRDIQLEEFEAAKEEGRKKKGLTLRFMDTTQAMQLRPDGHPGRYDRPKNVAVTLRDDCIHWCLPGPIDTWNDILLQMMKTEK